MELLHRENPEFALDIWLPKSPDLNPVDYRIWEERVYPNPSQDVADPWRKLMSVVIEAIDQWRKRLDASVRAQEGHF